MIINVGDLLTIENEKYITLEVLNYEGNNYAFVNKVVEPEEITEEFYIFEVLDDEVKIVYEENLKNILMPKFADLLHKDFADILSSK